MSFNKYRSTISWVTMLFFLATSVSHSQPVNASVSSMPEASISSSVALRSPETWIALGRDLPSELGQLGESFIPIDKAKEQILSYDFKKANHPFIVHIQDAHSNVEAQSRIQGVLDWLEALHKEHGLKSPLVIAFEGAVGRLHPEYLELFPQFPKANEAFVQDLKQKGELTGVELYAWEQYKKYKQAGPNALSNVILFGTEDGESFRKNLNAYRLLLSKQKELEISLRPWKAQLGIAQSRFLNPELRDFIRDSERATSLPVSFLKHIRSTLNIDLTDRIEQIRFPNLSRLVYLQDIRPLLDSELVHLEWDQFKLSLPAEKINQQDFYLLEAMVQGTPSSSVSLRKVIERIYQATGIENMRMKEYPHLSQWLSYHLLSQEIDARGFTLELEQLTKAIMHKLARTEKEKDFLDLYFDFHLLQKLFQGQISRDEFFQLLQVKEDINPRAISERLQVLLEGEVGMNKLKKQARRREKTLEKLFRLADLFYRGALERDQGLLKNALNFYDKKRLQYVSTENLSMEAGILVLISGGFHSDGLANLMREQDIAHMVITPRISSLEEENLYAKVIRGEHADLSNYFDREPLTKQEALTLRGLIEVAAPRLSEAYDVKPSEVPLWIHQVIERHPVLQQNLESVVPPNTTKPFTRVSIRDARDQNSAVNPANQAISEVYFTTGVADYGFLSSRTPTELANGVSAQQAFGAVVEFHSTPSGYVRITPIMAAGLGALAKKIMAGPLSIGSQQRGFQRALAESSIFTAGLFGSGSVDSATAVLPYRSEQRKADESQGLRTATLTLDGPTAPTQKEIDRLLKENDVLYVVADAHVDDTYEQYLQRFIDKSESEPGPVGMLGIALKSLRDDEYLENERRFQASEPSREPAHKVIIFKTWTGIGATQQFFNHIKFHRRPTEAEGANDYNFDVVFQPDFDYLNEEGNRVQGQIVYGLRDYRKESTNIDADRVRRARTIEMLTTIHESDQIQFVSDRSAEQSRNDLVIYLAAKLAHFNDLAQVSKHFGADLSAVTYGAGLDKRILKLFSNPGLGFGGRLKKLLDWIGYEHLIRTLPGIEGDRNIFARPAGVSPGVDEKISQMQKEIAAAIKDIQRLGTPGFDKTIQDILGPIPEELYYLLMIENIRAVNDQNIQNFNLEIVKYINEKKTSSVALLGAAYREGDEHVTKSPIKNIISDLVKRTDVRKFYIADKNAAAELKKWIEYKQSEKGLKKDQLGALIRDRHIEFIFEDEKGNGLDVHQAVEKADLAVLVTEAATGIKELKNDDNMNKFFNQLGDKPLFDAINFFGLRANGQEIYSFEELRRRKVNYFSVGRSGLGIFERSKRLLDSQVIGNDLVHGDSVSEKKTIEDYKKVVLDLQTDTSRKTQLAELFAEDLGKNEKAVAAELIQKTIAIVGGGYVGLVTAALMASLGHKVTVLDIPEKKAAMEALQGPDTEVPIFEPQLRELIIKGKEAGLIQFTAEEDAYTQAVKEAEIIYLAVGTPQKDDGAQDPKYILAASSRIGAIIREQLEHGETDASFKSIVIKSTVTPQVFDEIATELRGKYQLEVGEHYGLVSNPEFLREGQAIKDITVDLDRTVLGFYTGVQSEEQRRFIKRQVLELWYPLILRRPHAVLITDTATSTLVKYAANAFLAVSITMANVFADAAEQAGALYEQIEALLRGDERVGKNAFLREGCGYGGSCFPKDVLALNYLAARYFQSGENIPGSLRMIAFSHFMNQYYKTANIKRLRKHLGENVRNSNYAVYSNKSIAIWGMTFKPETDDMRESQPAHMLADFLKIGATNFRLRIDDPIFRVNDAPDREVKIKDFIDEIGKHFIHDESFVAIYTLENENIKSRYANDLKSYFREVYFVKNFMETGIVTFAKDALDALVNQDGSSVDALLPVTAWAEYKEQLEGLANDDSQLAKTLGNITILDATRILPQEKVQQIAAKHPRIKIVTPGRRSELRTANAALRKSLSSIRVGPQVNSDNLQRLIGSLLLGPYTTDMKTVDQLLAVHPELAVAHAVNSQITSQFFSPDLFKNASILAAVRYVQLITESKSGYSDEDPFAVQAVREALGPFQTLLDDTTILMEIISTLKNDVSPIHLFRLTAVLAAASRNAKSFSFIVEDGTPESARDLASELVEQMIALHLPVQDLLGQFRFLAVPADERAMKRAYIQLYSNNEKKYVAALSDAERFLKDLGYAPKLSRIHYGDQLNLNIAIMITAALLGQLKNPYEVVNAYGVGQQYGLDINSLVSAVENAIRVLDHLATQA